MNNHKDNICGSERRELAQNSFDDQSKIHDAFAVYIIDSMLQFSCFSSGN